MGICNRPEGRFAGRSAVQLPTECATQRSVVARRDFHEQIVLMLLIMNCLAIAQFSSGQKIWISAASNGSWLEAQHPAKSKTAAAYVPVSHTHEPVDAPELIVTSFASVSQELQECIPVHHHLPWPALLVKRVHGRRVRQPRRAGAVARGRASRLFGRHLAVIVRLSRCGRWLLTCVSP
jgi:hypothetical protein